MKEISSFDELPKSIEYETAAGRFYYHPTIIKFENHGLENAYFAMYARYYPKSGRINAEQVLFYVYAGSFSEVIISFLDAYSKNEKFVVDMKWIGERPLIINMKNRCVDGALQTRLKRKTYK